MAAAAPPEPPADGAPSPMELLLAGEIDGFLAAAAPGDAPLVFVHAPKTAGTSLRAELAARRQPEVHITVDHADTSRRFADRMDAAVQAFIEQAEAAPVRFASGHLLGHHLPLIAAALPGARFVTLLRDPVARLLSDYRYSASPRHPNHAAFLARVPSFAAYVERASERNKMAQHLLPPELVQRADPADCVAALLRRYAFVGVQEMYPISFRVLTALLGRPAWPSLRENVGPADGPPMEVPPALVARIRELHAVDVALHAHVRRGLVAIRDRLAARLAAG